MSTRGEDGLRRKKRRQTEGTNQGGGESALPCLAPNHPLERPGTYYAYPGAGGGGGTAREQVHKNLGWYVPFIAHHFVGGGVWRSRGAGGLPGRGQAKTAVSAGPGRVVGRGGAGAPTDKTATQNEAMNFGFAPVAFLLACSISGALADDPAATCLTALHAADELQGRRIDMPRKTLLIPLVGRLAVRARAARLGRCWLYSSSGVQTPCVRDKARSVEAGRWFGCRRSECCCYWHVRPASTEATATPHCSRLRDLEYILAV